MSAFAGLIVGLGNPGPKYDQTRHNLGFMLVDSLLAEAGKGLSGPAVLAGSKFSCELWKVPFPDGSVWLAAKPLTFMNLSGDCVQPLAAWHRIPPDRILVAHDELDLPPGRMRFKIGGGNAGHNGLASITQRLGTPDFYRLRLGIGRPPQASGNTISWVLGRFSPHETEIVKQVLPAAVDVVREFVLDGPARAQRLANGFALPQDENG